MCLLVFVHREEYTAYEIRSEYPLFALKKNNIEHFALNTHARFRAVNIIRVNSGNALKNLFSEQLTLNMTYSEHIITNFSIVPFSEHFTLNNVFSEHSFYLEYISLCFQSNFVLFRAKRACDLLFSVDRRILIVEASNTYWCMNTMLLTTFIQIWSYFSKSIGCLSM